MVTATTRKPEVKFALSQDEMRIGTEPLKLIGVYLAEPESVAVMMSAFAVSGALFSYSGPGIDIRTWVYSVAENIERRSAAVQPDADEHDSRMDEIMWLNEQRELRKRLAGQWVALQEKNLIAHGETLAEVLEKSRAKGFEHPFVTRLPKMHKEEVAVIV